MSILFFRQEQISFLYGASVLAAVDTLYWISCVTYSYKLAPPTLIGTMAALAGSFQWVIAKVIYIFLFFIFF